MNVNKVDGETKSRPRILSWRRHGTFAESFSFTRPYPKLKIRPDFESVRMSLLLVCVKVTFQDVFESTVDFQKG
jgi:hypothetical protein